jgi:spore germination protein YaaH
MRTRVPILLLAVLALWTALPVASALAASCRTAAPTRLSFDRDNGKTWGVLSWRAPRVVAPGVRYRVLRSGEVVGQTRAQRMRVAVRIGKRYRLTVRTVTRAGRLGCSATRSVYARYRLPSRPADLAASGASGASARVSWSRSKSGDARVVAYRVFRDAKVFRQVKGRSARLPLSSNRSYRVAVAAVDSRGRLSRRSRHVTVVTGHSAPPAPTGLHATDVTESEIGLAWSAVRPARGRLVGYRVFRNGTPVRQQAGTSLRLRNLAAARTHSLSVSAVDSLGYVSARSRPLSVTTARPVLTSGRTHAFLLASTGQSFVDFRVNYMKIGVVYPTYYDCDAASGLTGRDDPLVTSWAQARGVKVLPRFNCQKGDRLNRILNEPGLRQAWLDGMTALVDQHGYDGLNLDFEAGYASDRDAYTSFIADVAARMHARGKLLSVAVSAKTRDVPNHPRSTFFDYAGMSQHADYVFVMAWGIKWATSGPGSIDDIAWVRGVVDYVNTIPNKSRFVLGMPLYGMDWKNGGGTANPAAVWEYEDVLRIARETGSAPAYDAATDSMHFSYTDAQGAPHEMWFSDANTRATRIRLAQENGLGVGFWRLGREDQRLWGGPLP